MSTERDDQKQPVRHTSDDWCDILGVTVMDPDGWDRSDFARSWKEEITREEFQERLAGSSILAWPAHGLDR